MDRVRFEILCIDDMIKFIDAIRMSDDYVEDIYTQGGCYKFYELVRTFCSKCHPYINNEKTHVVIYFKNTYFDIRGIVSGVFYPMSDDDVLEAKKWSFFKNNLLRITECPACGEPITI